MADESLSQQALINENVAPLPPLSGDGSPNPFGAETRRRRSSVDASKLINAFAQSKQTSNATKSKNLMFAARAKVTTKAKASAAKQMRPRTPEAERVEDEAKSDKHPARVEPWGATLMDEVPSTPLLRCERSSTAALAHLRPPSPSDEDDNAVNTQASVDRVSAIRRGGGWGGGG
jgi:hypothetical protein